MLCLISSPPARYTEASLVKALEELGIGPDERAALAAEGAFAEEAEA